MTVIVDTCVWTRFLRRNCAVAVRHGMRILTTDTDFVEFAKHLPIELHAARGRR